MPTSNNIPELVVIALLTVFALALTLLAFLSLQQLRLLNRFLKTPLVPIFNLFGLLFFLLALVTLGITLLQWINLLP